LLRVIEDGIVIPVGSNTPAVVDVRIISATNKNLSNLVDENKFRQDLYFRIKGVNISIPPLRDRIDDIPLLIEHFIKEAVNETGLKVTGIADSAVDILKTYKWPGNIRQLKNIIRTMVVLCDRDKLDVQDIPTEIAKRPQLLSGSISNGNLAGVSLNELEKQAIIDTLNKTQGNREQAAKILGIGERTLYRKIREYGI
jgi:DNA-binding NtrC family response regulator